MRDSDEKIATEYFGGDEKARVVDPFKGDTPESKPSPGPWRWAWVLVSGDGSNLHRIAIYDTPVSPTGPREEMEANRTYNAALIAKAPEMAAMLRELEWSGMSNYLPPRNDADHWKPSCPCCEAGKPGPHAPDCRLAALLRELP